MALFLWVGFAGAASCESDRIPVSLGFALAEFVIQHAAPFRQFLIQGITHDGKVFRPSDWAERLCGVMSSFRPAGQRSVQGAHLQFSPYVHPVMVGNVKCVAVDERLDALEPMAMEFVRNFARDNGLPFVEICLVPEPDISATRPVPAE